MLWNTCKIHEYVMFTSWKLIYTSYSHHHVRQPFYTHKNFLKNWERTGHLFLYVCPTRSRSSDRDADTKSRELEQPGIEILTPRQILHATVCALILGAGVSRNYQKITLFSTTKVSGPFNCLYSSQKHRLSDLVSEVQGISSSTHSIKAVRVHLYSKVRVLIHPLWWKTVRNLKPHSKINSLFNYNFAWCFSPLTLYHKNKISFL